MSQAPGGAIQPDYLERAFSLRLVLCHGRLKLAVHFAFGEGSVDTRNALTFFDLRMSQLRETWRNQEHIHLIRERMCQAATTLASGQRKGWP